MTNDNIVTITEIIFSVWFTLAMTSPFLHINAMDKDVYYFSPCVLYRLTKMNWIGCFFISLLAVIINPLYCCMMTIIYIIFHICVFMCWMFHKVYDFIYYIFHVGRREHKDETN